VIDMAVEKGVKTIALGDLTGIREEKNFGAKTNQKFHRWPFRKVMELIQYKASMAGIAVVKTDEKYTSQTCSACKPMPDLEYARKSDRIYRGLFVCKDCGTVLNADVNGAINIAKKYLEALNERPVVALGTPKMYRFDGCSFVA